MKKVFTIFLIGWLIVNVNAQTIDLQVISSSGNYSEAGGISLSWTLGEPVIATFENGGLILTQGFQQPLFTFTGHLLEIPAGWSGVSSWVAPTVALAEDIFEPVVDNLVILLNPYYDVYWPDMGVNDIDPPPAEQLGWVSHHGYIVKMTQEVLVVVEGFAEANVAVDLPSGWFIIPVLAQNNIPSGALFAQLEDLVIVKEIAGYRIWWPAMGIFTLNIIEPGKSYQVLLSSTDVLDYEAFNAPVPIGPSYIELNQLVNNTPWNDVELTGASHTIAIDKGAWDSIEGIAGGDYLGVFTQNGRCAGMILYSGISKPLSITAFSDDISTPSLIEGFIEEEYMSFRLFRPASAEEFDVEATFDPALPNTDVFHSNGLSRITSMSAVATSLHDPGLGDVEIFPNPSSEWVTIQCIGTFTGEPRLYLYSMESGQLIRTMRLESNRTDLDIRDLAQGVYFVKIMDGKHLIVRKLVKHSIF